jgi:probable FeS assembly SUF system protein SufT
MTKAEQTEPSIKIDGENGTATIQAMRTVTDERVWDALRQCYDPEIPVNIVDLGLIYEVKVEEEIPEEANVYVQMTLTAPGCGMGPMIAADVKRRIQQIPGVSNVLVDLVFEPMWNPEMMSEAAKLTLNMS